MAESNTETAETATTDLSASDCKVGTYVQGIAKGNSAQRRYTLRTAGKVVTLAETVPGWGSKGDKVITATGREGWYRDKDGLYVLAAKDRTILVVGLVGEPAPKAGSRRDAAPADGS